MVQKLVKFGIGFIIFTALLIVIAVMMITRIDPNDYKPQIQQLAKDQINADLTINSIAWQLWPNLQLQLEGVELNSFASSHAKLMAIQNASVSVAVMPLLRKQVVVDHVTLNKPSIWFHQYPDETHNWQPLLDAVASAPTPTEEPTATTTTMPLALAADRIEIIAGEILVSGLNTAKIQPLNLDVQNVQFGEPMKFAFNVALDTQGHQLQLETQANVTLSEDMTELTLADLVLALQGNQPQQTAKLNAFANVNLQSMASTLEMVVEPINVDAWLALLPAPEQTQPKTKPTTSAPAQTKTAPTPIPREMLQGLQANGKVQFKEIIYKNAPHSFAVNLNANQGIINLNQIELQAYKGSAKGLIELNAKANPTALKMQFDITDMSIASLMQTWLNVEPMQGSIASNININTTGNTVEALLDGLKGQLQLQMGNATLPKINLHELLWAQLQSKQGTLVKTMNEFPQLKAELGTLKTPKVLRGQTELSDFLAQLTMTPDIIQSQQLTATLNDQPVKAQFIYGRKTQSITLNTALQLPFGNPDLASIVWPMACTGSISGQFDCKVDTKALKPILTNLIKQEAKTKLKAELAPHEAKAKQELKETEDKVKAKVEEKLGRELKNLFK